MKGFFLIFLSICIVVCNFVENAPTNDPNNIKPFGGKSFSIRSSVFESESDRLKPIAHLKESYSVEQMRARLEIDLVDKVSQYKLFTYYHDGTDGTTFYTKKENGKTNCTLSSVNQFKSFVGVGDLPEEFEKGPEGFVIGPAKIIFFLVRNFNLKDWHAKSEFVDENNIKTYEYLLRYNSKDGRTYTFQVLYDDTSLQHDPYPVPLRVRYANGKRQHTFSFSKPEVLDTISAHDQQATSNSQVAMDYFAFQLGAGCSSALKGREKGLFDNLAGRNVKFSFTAKEDYSSDVYETSWKKNLYVAYDSSLAAMRIDKITGGQSSGSVWKQIHQFNLCRTYHLTRPEAAKDKTSGAVLDLSSSGKGTTCAISTLPCYLTDKKPTFAELLTGADKFVYMGKAKVRGVDARVYESRLGVLPAWLETPLTYIDLKNDTRIRDSDLNEKVHGERLINVVIYLREASKQKPILLMEIEKSRPPILDLDSKQSLSVYDFKWSLDYEAPDGSRQDELFSLGDQCNSVNKGPEFRLSVDLTTKQLISGNSSLNVPSTRNLALISVIQSNFVVQAPMISDIESKIIKVEDPKTTSSIIHASLRFTKPPRKLVLMKYLGQGMSNANSQSLQVQPGAISIRECFNLASHLGFTNVFGYDPISSKCIVDTKPLEQYTGISGIKQDGPFKFSELYFYEIYKLVHTDDLYSNWRYHQGIEEERKYLNREVELVESDSGPGLIFRITGVKVEDNRQKVISNITEQVSTISGFGLLPSDQQGAKSWFVNALGIVTGSDEPEEDSESEMTIDQCKTACMTDTSCRSYSTCLKKSRIQCTLSEVAFTSKNVTSQFKLDSLTKAKRNSRVKVNVTLNGAQEPLPVELSKNPTCQINNKIYTDFYRLGTNYNVDTIFKDVYQSTENIEDCARMCLEANLQPIEADVSQHLDKENKIIIDANTGGFFRTRWNLLNRHICNDFQYVSKSRATVKLLISLDNLAINRHKILDQQSVDGYCFFDKNVIDKANGTSENGQPASEQSSIYVLAVRYYFNFETLYERRHGVQLRGSDLSEKEQNALVSMFTSSQFNWQPSESDASILNELTKKRFNHRHSYLRDMNSIVEMCASDCAFQRATIYPSCRSFDVVTETINSKQTTNCYFNSITLKEARATLKSENNNLNSLVLYNTNEDRQVWHFEPKAGFVLSESMLIYDMEHHHPVSLKSRSNSFGSTLGLLIVIVLGVVCGLLLGAQTGKRLVNYSNQMRRQSIHDNLVNRNIGINLDSIE